MSSHHYAVIMAGGSGTRFWPKSRRKSAKQVLRLFGERSLIQQTVDRLRSVVPPEKVWVITNRLLEAEIRKQLPEIPKKQIVAEPAPRNTAPCIALAAHILAQSDPEAVMGVFPADHLISKESRFRKFVRAAFREAGNSSVVVLGVRPRWAETGYGYIEFASGVGQTEMLAARVASFREKPDSATAKKFVDAGTFYWNAGMFFWRASTALELMRRHQPKTAALLAGLPSFGSRTFFSELARIYPLCDGISVDYAIIEKADHVAGFALDDIGWNDVGSWDAVYQVAKKDANWNVAQSEVIAENSRDNYIDAGKLVALVGVDNLIVVDTADALLIARRDRAQDVSKVVKALQEREREELL
jgi:mannose-1-phosphate guanylyltransferase